MLLLRRPSEATICRFLDSQRSLSFSYPHVGATASEPPPAGYTVDHTRVNLGNGQRVFDAARSGLERWEHFRLGWVEAWPSTTPIQPGEAIAVVARSFRLLWSLNACRIVRVIDEHGPIRRFGFAYGTLPGHVELGEERFLLEFNQTKGDVSYDILALSRPNHILARLGYPMARRLQKRFARDSAAAMQRCARGI
ncbi:MAG TPA: DUF1990 domain-containing protein [Pirellulales bacterium]|jgi:uncharacterized protein (UPF0548 family)|nr:DUF1990 domain-containing protein [Pirellulales bacterium]